MGPGKLDRVGFVVRDLERDGEPVIFELFGNYSD